MSALACSNHLGETAVYRCGPCDQALCAACAVELEAAGTAKCRTCGAMVQPVGGGKILGDHRAPRPETPVWSRLPDVFRYMAKPSVLLVLAGLALLRYLLGFVPLIGGLLSFGISAGLFFHIVSTSAFGDRDLEAPDFTDIWDDILAPAVRYLAAVAPILVALFWAGSAAMGVGLQGGSPLDALEGMQGPLALLVVGVVLLPLLLAIGGLGQSVLAMYNPATWIDSLRKMGADYAAGALLFYLVLFLEYGLLHPALLALARSAHIPFVTSLLVGFVALLPWAFRARLIGAVCERYTERSFSSSLPQATAVAGGAAVPPAPVAAALPPPPSGERPGGGSGPIESAPGSQEESLRRALEAGDLPQAGDLAPQVLEELARERRPERVTELFRELDGRFSDLALTDRGLAAAARSAHQVGDAALTVRAVQRMLKEHPQSELLPAAMWTAAGAQESQGRADLAEKTLRSLIERFPGDPISEQARLKLGRS